MKDTLADIIGLAEASEITGLTRQILAKHCRNGTLRPAKLIGTSTWITTRQAARSFEAPPPGRPIELYAHNGASPRRLARRRK